MNESANFTKYFSVKGFKKFKDWVEIKLRPLTILVGPNNSGKSSVFEAMRFIEERVFPLNLNESLDVELSEKEQIQFHDIFEIKYEIDWYDRKYSGVNEKSLNYSKKFSGYQFYNHLVWKKVGQRLTFESMVISAVSSIGERYFVASNKDKNDLADYNQFEDGLPISLLYEGFLGLKCNLNIGQIYMDSDHMMLFELYYENNEAGFLKEYKLSKSNNPLFKYNLTKNEVDSKTENITEYINQKYLKHLFTTKDGVLMKSETENELELQFPSIYSFDLLVDELFDDGINLEQISNDYVLITYKFLEFLRNIIIAKRNNVVGVNHIPLIKHSNRAVYNKDEFLGTILSSILKKSTSSERDEINRWIKKFNIGTELRIAEVAFNEFSAVVVDKNDERPLSSLGTGAIQVACIIMALQNKFDSDETRVVYGVKDINLNRFKNTSLFFEEPEANLHPNYQALLADLFVDCLFEKPKKDQPRKQKSQLLIETHSEYLIRKLQYLVANGDLRSNDVVLYYFPGPEGDDDRIKDIGINKDGTLTEPFGAGFYDEALNWRLELLKFKNRN